MPFFKKIRLSTLNELNNQWRALFERSELTIEKRVCEIGSAFLMGSCFAEYLREALQKHSVKCHPSYQNLTYDKSGVMCDTLNFNVYHMNHYSPISIRQELERSISNDLSYTPVKVDGLSIISGKKVRTHESCYQDPYRREVYANQKDDIDSLINSLNALVRSGIQSSTDFIITLGLIEIFKRKDGRAYNQFPKYLGVGYSTEDLTFHRMTTSEVVDELRKIIFLIKSVRRNARIHFTVSPVPLQKTFSQEDVFVANCYSKSVLRSAVEEVLSEAENVYYFPSYEIALNIGSDFYQTRDMRHAKKEYVDMITQTFLKSTMN